MQIGSAHSSLQSAMNENDDLVAQQKPRLTHFLSIPINNENVVERFKNFKVRFKADLLKMIHLIPSK